MKTSEFSFLIVWLIASVGFGALLIFKTDPMQNLYGKILHRMPKLGGKFVISPNYMGSPFYASQMRIAGALILFVDVFVICVLFFAR